ncbi:MAG: serine/threonine-protein kinase [Luteolibacter sp.]|uniref:serine/threonine protein kinase n=1 Tax=Luteolibacter sp. TaxID=1962973 RepID=UPI00326641A6
MNDSKQIEDALFFTALHITEPVARRGFLDRACGSDHHLRRVVEDMLAAEEGADQLLNRGLSAIARSGDEFDNIQDCGDSAGANERIGARIGPYLLRESLGKGGGGEVYLAEQHEPVHRKVALKIIKLGMDTRSVIARFEAERQALAMMDHPYIARVLDAGSTAFGRPYFVLELVNGTPITDFCNAQGFTLRERIGLVINVCHAIQHAHQKGIIHRDIKPSNVLVSLQDGIALPKVIDFGIAKAIEGNLGEETSQTMPGQLLGTPAYMSPEQANIHLSDIDTRTDIYSLGALLYEIVTGHPPFEARDFPDVARSSLPELLLLHEPVRPSVLLRQMKSDELAALAKTLSTEPSKLVSMIGGDLDWIIVKAMEKDRTRRYETANGMALDLQRFLDNQPILARPPGRAYVLRKLIRRNRAVFVSSGLVVLALVGGFGTSTILFFKARRAEMRQAELRRLTEESLKNEAKLRRAAETRSRLTEAVTRVRQEDFEGAAKILSEMETPPSEPSLDAITALRDVGMWLGGHKRWAEARKCFEWLLEIDKLDPWRTVTLNYQACGALLGETGEPQRYFRFCNILCKAHSDTTDGDEAGRILKSCLLMPLTADLRNSLEKIAATNERWLEMAGPQESTGWGPLPSALWRYRIGDDDAAIRIASAGSKNSNSSQGYFPSYHAILAMACEGAGDHPKAIEHFEIARTAFDVKWSSDLSSGNGQGYWYDWLFAKVLLKEAAEKLGQVSH